MSSAEAGPWIRCVPEPNDARRGIRRQVLGGAVVSYRRVRTTKPDAVGLDIRWPNGSVGRFVKLEARNGAPVDLGYSSTLDGLLGVAANLLMRRDCRRPLTSW